MADIGKKMAITFSKWDLNQISTDELLQLFATLEAPVVQEMQGDYKAQRHIPLLFVLEGLVAPYLCDIGGMHNNFLIGPQELPAISGA